MLPPLLLLRMQRLKLLAMVAVGTPKQQQAAKQRLILLYGASDAPMIEPAPTPQASSQTGSQALTLIKREEKKKPAPPAGKSSSWSCWTAGPRMAKEAEVIALPGPGTPSSKQKASCSKFENLTSCAPLAEAAPALEATVRGI